MEAARREFERRVLEIEGGIRLLDRLQAWEVVGRAPRDSSKTSPEHGSAETLDARDVLHSMKGAALLMIYNLVEATTREAFRELYQAAKVADAPFQALRREMQDAWIQQRTTTIMDPLATRDTLRRTLGDSIRDAFRVPVRFQVDALFEGGNLNHQRIHALCRSHGFALEPDPACRGGVSLESIRKARNDLAHGNATFEEVGRRTPLEEISRMKDESVLFLRALMDAVENHVQQRGFLQG